MSQNIIQVVNARRMRWDGHVALMKEKRNAYSVSVGKSEGKDHLEDLVVAGEKKTLKWSTIVLHWVEGYGLD
jgi:hypothetical protein